MLAAAAGLGLLVGLVVGGVGGGGGVLVVPILVYLLGQTAQNATTGSVVIVGVTAAAGVLTRLRGGIDWRTGLAFGGLGIPSAYVGTHLNRHVAQPVLLLAFAAVTLLAAVALLIDARGDGRQRDRCAPDTTPAHAATGKGTVLIAASDAPARDRVRTVLKVIGCGVAVGFLTGFLGVGGGFLVVPALVIVLGLPMARAVGTSLLILTLNSVSSFVSRIGGATLDWRILIPFTTAAVVGTIAAKPLAARLSGATLTRVFASLLLAVGAFVAVESVLAL